MHENRENKSGNHTVCSGISIPFELLDDIIETLSKVKKIYLKIRQEKTHLNVKNQHKHHSLNVYKMWPFKYI